MKWWYDEFRNSLQESSKSWCASKSGRSAILSRVNQRNEWSRADKKENKKLRQTGSNRDSLELVIGLIATRFDICSFMYYTSGAINMCSDWSDNDSGSAQPKHSKPSKYIDWSSFTSHSTPFLVAQESDLICFQAIIHRGFPHPSIPYPRIHFATRNIFLYMLIKTRRRRSIDIA